jgi:phosphoribosylformimino-5-aminoimidazole carboxamide ribotide isomerase
MTRFRPCIDLHAGQVKQIVGGTLDSATSELKTNFVSPHPPAHFANLYKDNGLTGSHVIMLGPGNRDAALESLAAWPGGLQVGGGITDKNAMEWIEAGAEKVGVCFFFPFLNFLSGSFTILSFLSLSLFFSSFFLPVSLSLGEALPIQAQKR